MRVWKITLFALALAVAGEIESRGGPMAAPAHPEGDGGPQAAGEPVPSLIARLGDRRWTVREDAQRRLLELGAPALPGLREATGSPNPEVAQRARYLLDRLDPLQVRFRILRLDAGDETTLTWTGETVVDADEEAEIGVPGGDAPISEGAYVLRHSPLPGDRLTIEPAWRRTGTNTRLTLRPPLDMPGALSAIDSGQSSFYLQVGSHIQRQRHRYVVLMEYARGRRSTMRSEASPAPGTRLGVEVFLGRLRDQASSGEAPARREAIRILGLLGDRGSTGLLREALSSGKLRAAATLALGRMGDPPSLDALSARLAGEQAVSPPIPAGPRDLTGPERETGFDPDEAALCLLEQRVDAAALEHVEVQLGNIAQRDSLEVLSTLAEGLEAGRSPDSLGRPILELLTEPDVLRQAPWHEISTEYFYLSLVASTDERDPEHQRLLSRLLAGFAASVFDEDSSTITGGAFLAFLHIWDRVSRRFDVAPGVEAFLPRLVSEVRSHFHLPKLAQCLTQTFRDEPLPEPVFRELASSIATELDRQSPGRLSATLGLLLHLSRHLSLSEPQLPQMVQLILDSVSTSRYAYRADLIGEIERLTGLGLESQGPGGATSRVTTATSGSRAIQARLQAIRPRVQEWLADPEAIRASHRRLTGADAAGPIHDERTGEVESARLEFMEFDLLLTVDEQAEGGPVRTAGARRADEPPVGVRVLDGRRYSIREGVPFSSRDRWGNVVVHSISRGPTSSRAPRLSYRLDAALSLTAGVPITTVQAGRTLRVGRYETTLAHMGAQPARDGLRHSLTSLVRIRPLATGEKAANTTEPLELWREFKESFVASIDQTEDSPTRKKILQIVETLHLVEAIPSLRRGFENAPDIETARVLLGFGEPRALSYLRDRLDASTPIAERARAAQVLTEQGHGEGMRSLTEILDSSPRSRAISPYQALQSFETFLDSEGVTAVDRREVVDFVVKNLDQTSYQTRGFRILAREAGTDFGYADSWRISDVAERRRAQAESVARAKEWWASRPSLEHH